MVIPFLLSQNLLDRLVDGRFEFSLRGWKAPAAPFFAASPWRGEILTERRYWLAEDPDKHLFYTPAAEEIVEEVSQSGSPVGSGS